MQNWVDTHASIEAMEETAEMYVLSMMDAAERRRYEQHLLLCSKCRDSVQTVRDFVEVFRMAVAPKRDIRLSA